MKPLELDKLRDTHRKLRTYLTPTEDSWWTKTLDNIEEEDKHTCKVCTEIRTIQLANCRFKHDDPDTAREKARRQREADKRLLFHLQDHNHDCYPKDMLFPPSGYTWNSDTKSYDDDVEDTLELKEHERKLVEVLESLRQDSTETHFVGVPGLCKRSSSDKDRLNNPRPPNIGIGHIVVVRSDDNDKHSSYLPFFVGEVLGFEDQLPEESESKVLICEYSCKQLVEAHKAVRPQDVAPQIDKVRWQANFRGKDSGQLQRDEFHTTASCKPSNGNYTPLTRKFWISSVAEYDTPENLLNHGGKRQKGRTLKSWVLKVLSSNPRINWKLPPKQGRKRKNPG